MFVRTASDRDVKAIRALLVETWHDAYDAIYGPAKVTKITDEWHSIRALTARLAQPRSEFLVADSGEALGGVAFAQSDETGDSVTLRELHVLPAMQGRDIGDMLLEEIIESFPEAKRFETEVEQASAGAIEFYAAHGFADAGAANGAGATMRKMVFRRGE